MCFKTNQCENLNTGCQLTEKLCQELRDGDFLDNSGMNIHRYDVTRDVFINETKYDASRVLRFQPIFYL